APAMVWEALTDPEQLSEWAPFDTDRNLASAGPMKLSTVGTPTPQVAACDVKRAEAPRLLEYNWGDQNLRWELEPLGAGTRLRLRSRRSASPRRCCSSWRWPSLRAPRRAAS